MKIKQDYALPFWYREQTKFRKFISSWGGFIVLLLLLTLGGAVWK